MSNFPSTARVVIIGGGVVGVSSLYHLAKAGWTDCVLLEKNELTAGSTWHAAGNCPNFSTSWAIMNMQRYSLGLYAGLEKEVDYPMNYHVTGSIRLAHSKERMQEFERARSMGNYQGLDLEMMAVSDMKDRYPFIETHDLEGGLWDPADGDIDPAQLTQALAKGAREMGARIERFCPATGVTREGSEWIVHTDKGDIRCEYVVNAAGYYAQRVAEWFKPYGGRTLPMTVMSHQYFLTEEIPELAAWTKENGRKVPLLRDVDTSYYLRQDKNGLNLGPYERNCKAHWVTPQDPMPEDFSFQLYPDDLERLEWYIEDAMARVPILGTAGVGRVINGPIPYAPDGLPLIGPMPGVPNAFEACVFTFGITQGGGAGKVLAEWITEGQTEWDMWAVDPRRYTDYTDQDYCDQKAMETYGHEYAMHFPHHVWPAGRDRKLSPVHDKILAAGGQMGTFNGWERANWFAKPGDDTSEQSTQTWDRNGPWALRVKEEVEAVRDGVGVLDLPGFSRFNLSGDGAAEWLRGRITGGLPKVGRMNLAYFGDNRGRILTEMSILRHGEDHFTLITAATAQWHDFDVLRPARDAGLTLTDHTTEYSTLIVTGPQSRALFEALETKADLSLGWLTHQAAEVAGTPCALARVSFAGELGWEIHAANADIPALYDAVIGAGAKPFGMFALNSMRIEKGYRAWKGDLSTDYTLLEGGLDRFVKLDKPQDFPGKAAMQLEKQSGSKKRFVIMTVDAGDQDAPYMSTVWHDGAVVGETTSGDWGYRVNSSIALGMLRADLAVPGTEVEIDIFGKMCKATVQPDQPLWDPQNERIRA
ncbi:FAD-dependent oxidoreductase [Sulfitobacter mediterraneus]|uniref:GcvT family protein n=1 Tax=Sulfitobacter mediterraneus TaxID=83219 RepID=UPI0019331710|nr:FAD-dependent oxidoreductase [Sulfitobacter mediterraneus]MBM1632660.1 FAD-dependent oxidoreductase [Sulfitobacter mediterraneus]MBM1641206.1 FAD-dependent oxidoreductase [Sulfitobacter mediterraneus]MBM1644525.1 FAD-dependent oxidoreductase [Sulfitobacter mediterraneus]MBM1649326.1 FAD-dependent oxidoreductase [Sulfitobacter mediterraneus]MBM1653347.1 FAD-dependent oxidoreductase [Sulfitobacter mediterraneus]